MPVRIILGIVVLVGVYLWFMNPARQSGRSSFPVHQPLVMPLVNTAFTLNAAQGTHWNFNVPAGATDVRVEGTFSASGGSGNDVEVYLLTDDELVNWQNGHSVNTLYNSGRMTQGTVNAVLPGPGTYHLVFNNKFSLLSPKAVKANIRLRYSL